MNAGLHETPNEGKTEEAMTENSVAIRQSHSDKV